MPRVSQAALARHLEVSRAAVHQAIKAGRLTLGADGKLDVDEATAQWAGEVRQPRDSHDPDGGTLADAHKRKELALAELAELKAAVMRGDLLDRLTVESQWFATLRTLRDRLMGIPDRLAILVAAESDEHEVRLMLATEIRESLTTVADGLEGDP